MRITVTFAVATALGARKRQLRGLIAAEVAVLVIGGLGAGAAGLPISCR